MQSGGVYTRHRMEAQTGTANIEDRQLCKASELRSL